jgi:ubiquinone/menaquinone biosynthesis C-methylase UbiE
VIDRATSFDKTAEEYERTRPEYPDAILDVLPLPSDATVVDVGAGTGKLTRVLARRYEKVVAVEPLDGMRSVLQRVLPSVEALKGSAEKIPLPDGSVDGVFAAQAFHWFDKATALPEFARVLRPGGIVAVVWNGLDESRPNPLPADFQAALHELHEEATHAWKDEPEWEDVLASVFTDVHPRVTVAHDHVLDRPAMLDNLRTVSWIATRDNRDEVLGRLGDLLPAGTHAIPNLAHVLWAVRA